FSQLHVGRFGLATAAPERTSNVETAALAAFDPKPADAVQQLIALAAESRVTVFCDNQGEADRLHELIAQVTSSGGDGQKPPAVETTIGYLHQGFRWGSIALVANREIFHRYSQRHRIRRVATGRPLDSFLDLQPNDFVVHVVHGIAQFIGMKTMQK